MPVAIRDLLEKNNLGPGILDRKTGLLYGQGPMLYRINVVNNERIQEWLIDDEIQEWLDSWDYKQYIRSAFVEYTHMKGVFAKYYCAKSLRIGKPWITRLECLHSKDCLLEYPENGSRMLDDVKHILTGDIENNRNLKLYPVFTNGVRLHLRRPSNTIPYGVLDVICILFPVLQDQSPGLEMLITCRK